MVISLQFESSVEEPVTLGPAPWFRVSGNFIRQGPHGEIVGTFRHHHWEVRSRQYVVIRSNNASIHFRDAEGGRTEPFGPFESLMARDGTVFADGEPFSKFQEETQLWHCYPTETFWSALVFEAPGRTGDLPGSP